VLPIGLPWLGAHFRLDALAAFFLLLLNLVAALVSVFALGYARHDAEPERALPVYPTFLAAMNLVLLADDAYVFLVSWEFMSLTSWLLVLANHRRTARATLRSSILSWRASARGAAALLRPARRRLGRIRVRGDPRRDPPAATATIIVMLVLSRRRLEGRAGALHAWLPLAHPARQAMSRR